MRRTLLPLLTRFEGGSQAASSPPPPLHPSTTPPPLHHSSTPPTLRFRCCFFHWAAFCIISNLHGAFGEEGQHFAALANALGQLYPRPSGAHSLSPLNLPNYASHQLFSRSIAVIPETRHARTPPIFRLLCLYVCVRPLLAAFGLVFAALALLFPSHHLFFLSLLPLALSAVYVPELSQLRALQQPLLSPQ